MAEVVEFGGDLLGRARPNVLASESKISNSFKRCFANCLFVNEPLPLTASQVFHVPKLYAERLQGGQGGLRAAADFLAAGSLNDVNKR